MTKLKQIMLDGESRKPVLKKTKKLVRLRGVFMKVITGRKYWRNVLMELSKVELEGTVVLPGSKTAMPLKKLELLMSKGSCNNHVRFLP